MWNKNNEQDNEHTNFNSVKNAPDKDQTKSDQRLGMVCKLDLQFKCDIHIYMWKMMSLGFSCGVPHRNLYWEE